MNRAEIAVNTFKDGFNCAQSVLSSFCDRTGISRDMSLKLANGFGAGMGRKQEVCGAVSGGILVISLLHGRGENGEIKDQETTYLKVRELMDKFGSKHETVSCRKLIDECELLTSEGQKRFVSENMIERCHSYVEYTVKVLEEILDK